MQRVEDIETVLDQGMPGGSPRSIVAGKEEEGDESSNHEQAGAPVGLKGENDKKTDDKDAHSELLRPVAKVLPKEHDEDRSKVHVVSGIGQNTKECHDKVTHDHGDLPAHHDPESYEPQAEGVHDAGVGKGHEAVSSYWLQQCDPAKVEILERQV